jgi:hypothetical protein
MMSFKFQSDNILLVCAASLFVVGIVQLAMGSKLRLVTVEGKPYEDKPRKYKSLFNVFREDSYLRTIAIFTAFSVFTTFFIQYLFLALAREQYPVAENLAAFLGIFTCIMMIFILSLKYGIFPYLFHNYGLRTCLLISPILIAVFTALIIAIGLFMGYTPGTPAGFILFFLLLAVLRIISKSLKDTVEFPTFQVIYHSIDQVLKSEFQSEAAGSLNEISVFFAGVLLTVFGLFSFIKLIHFSLILLILAFVWMFVALRLFREYRKTLIKETEKAALTQSVGDISINQDPISNRFYAYINFRKDYFSLISGDFSVFNKTTNNWYFEEIIKHAYSKKDLNLMPALKKSANNTNLDAGIRQHSAEIVKILQNHSVSLNTDIDKTSGALKILSGTRMPQTTEILRLLRDNSVEAKKLGIYMIGKFRITDLLSEVCTCLSIPILAKDAYEVIKSFGPVAEDELVRLYLITSGNTKLSKIILQLLGSICTQVTTGFLYSRLWSNSRQLKEVAVKCLISCEFKPSEEEKQRLNLLIFEVIGIVTWNLSAKISLERDNDNFLLEKINLEIERWNKFLFNLLSITYHSGSIARITEYIRTGNIGSVIYGLEMADIIVSDLIKAPLIALLDDVPDEDKLKNLFQYFPGEIPTRKKLLEDIINRDYNLISLWTKACTLRSIATIESNEVAESVTALLFSPEELMREESASLIARANPELYHSASDRLPDLIKIRLENIIDGTTEKAEFIFEKVQFLSKYFGVGREEELLSVVSELKYMKKTESESFSSSEGWIVWQLNNDSDNNEVEVIYDGDIDKLTRKFKTVNNIAFYFLSLNAVEEYHFQYPDKSYEILKYIDINEE